MALLQRMRRPFLSVQQARRRQPLLNFPREERITGGGTIKEREAGALSRSQKDSGGDGGVRYVNATSHSLTHI